MTDLEIIEATKIFVQKELTNAEGGHDWFHILRVFNNAKLISENENADGFIVALGSLLHDIADSKFHDGDESIGPKVAREFLFKHDVDSVVIEHVIKIIENISFNKSLDGKKNFNSLELEVIQDADRLDAIGAIGIARCFNYGGFKDRKLFDPEIKPNLKMTKEEYKNSDSPTINHFYEKLLLLKGKMNTKTGKQIAANRHQFMELYLEQFYAEWDGEK
ncbi:MAG: HD domain-containing protein [Flavobacteriaceae bacterium]|nr:HD domain-containing protein [Flavobacteriaceae bacterium]